MPEHVVNSLSNALNERGTALKDAKIMIVGVAYKRNVEDTRESPALAIIKLLLAKFARVSYFDPDVPRLRSRHLDKEMRSVCLTTDQIASSDAIVIVTDHSGIDYALIVEAAKLVIDTKRDCFISQTE